MTEVLIERLSAGLYNKVARAPVRFSQLTSLWTCVTGEASTLPRLQPTVPQVAQGVTGKGKLATTMRSIQPLVYFSVATTRSASVSSISGTLIMTFAPGLTPPAGVSDTATSILASVFCKFGWLVMSLTVPPIDPEPY